MARSGWPPPATNLARPEFLNELGMISGASHQSTAIIADGTPAPEVRNPVTDYIPSGRPGGRAPHAWIERDGTRLSTLDLFGDGFVLLAGEDGPAWCDAARNAARQLGVPLTACTVGADGDLRDPDKQWATLYGADPHGAVLVRPDGHVGWRNHPLTTDPRGELARALRRLLATQLSPHCVL